MCNKNLVFPAIIKKDGNAYLVTFPDLEGCFTDGETLADAFVNACDALALYIHDLKEIPTPSLAENIETKEGEYIMLIAPDTEDNIEYVKDIDFTEVLEKALAEKGYSKYKVAKILGLSESYINLIVAGKRVPSTEIAQRLSDLLEIDWRVFYPAAKRI